MRDRNENKIILTLIRHGKTAANHEARYIGSTDEGLSDDAEKELEALRGRFKAQDMIFSSPMKRCLQSTHIIFNETDPVVINELKEMNFGDFEYKNYKELKDDMRYQAWIDGGGTGRFPNGESRDEFIERTMKGFYMLISMARTKGAHNIAAVVHGGTIMAILSTITPKDYFEFRCECAHGYTIELLINASNIEAGDLQEF